MMVEWLVPVIVHTLAVVQVDEETPESTVQEIALCQVSVRSDVVGVEYEFEFAELGDAIRSTEEAQE